MEQKRKREASRKEEEARKRPPPLKPEPGHEGYEEYKKRTQEQAKQLGRQFNPENKQYEEKPKEIVGMGMPFNLSLSSKKKRQLR